MYIFTKDMSWVIIPKDVSMYVINCTNTLHAEVISIMCGQSLIVTLHEKIVLMCTKYTPSTFQTFHAMHEF